MVCQRGLHIVKYKKIVEKGENVMDEQQMSGEMDKSTEQMIKKLRRELVFTRVMCLVTSVLTILLLIGGAYISKQVYVIMKQAQPVLDQITAVDVGNVNETLRQVRISLENVDLEQVAASMEQAVEMLNEVDIESLNNAISGLDTEELSKTLANLNDAVESLQKVEDSLGSLFGKRKVIFN